MDHRQRERMSSGLEKAHNLIHPEILKESTRLPFGKVLRPFPVDANRRSEAESQRIDTRGVSAVYNTPFLLSRLQRIL